MDTTKTVHRNLIGGEWCEPADAIRNINPSDTRETVGLYARGDAADAQRAVEAARRISRMGRQLSAIAA